MRGGVELTGEYRSRAGHRRAARWRITASSAGAALSLGCSRGATLATTEWLPRRGTLVRGERFLSRAGYRLRLSTRPRARTLSTAYANARQPSLAAVRLSIPCRRSWITVRWTGGALAGG